MTARSLSASETPLGADPDARFRQTTGKLDAGESLLLFSRGYLTPVDQDVLETDEGVRWPRSWRCRVPRPRNRSTP